MRLSFIVFFLINLLSHSDRFFSLLAHGLLLVVDWSKLDQIRMYVAELTSDSHRRASYGA